MSLKWSSSILLLLIAILALGAVAASINPGEMATDSRSPSGTGNESSGGTMVNPGAVPPSTSNSTLTPIQTKTAATNLRSEIWTLPLPLLTGALILAVGGAFVFLYIRNGGYKPIEENDQLSEERNDRSDDLNHVGEAAGEAADEIEAQEEMSNEVYRAWTEMVNILDIDNSETTTPDEFKQYAISIGMHPDHVSELTQLFEEVRYGELAPDEREERAIAALRRIEAAYSDNEDLPADNGGSDR